MTPDDQATPVPFDDYVDPEGDHEEQLPSEQVEALTAADVQPLIQKEIG